MAKPGVLVLSKNDDTTFDWMSDGWNETKKAHTAEAKRLMTRATKCIKAGKSVLDVIARLEKAGFKVTRIS